MKIDRKQLISAVLALCVLIGCVAVLIVRGFQLRFAISAVLALAWVCISGWAAFHGGEL